MKAIVVLGFAVLLAGCKAGPRRQSSVAAVAPAAKPASSWEYKADGGSSWACTISVDNAAKLCFRRMQGRIDSYVTLPYDGGMFFCYTNHCQAKIRVDAEAVRTVEGTDDESGNTRTLFLPASKALLDEVQGARELKISPPMFGVDQVFVFEVSGLKWP